MKFRCRVAPYALFNALAALENTRDSQRYIEYGVTQEDGYLVIWGEEKLVPRCDSTNCTAFALNEEF